MSYPEKLIRGISSLDFVDADGRATAGMFQFDKCDRKDGYDEVSINWFDNQHALDIIVNQRKQDKEDFQFKVGYALLKRSWLDDLISRPNSKSAIAYERDPIEDSNPYHGNILRKSMLSPGVKNMFASSVANCVEIIIYR